MLDIKLIREKPDYVIERLSTRHQEFPITEVIKLDSEWRKLHYAVDLLKSKKNQASIEVSKAKDSKEKQKLINETKKISEEITGIDEKKRLLKQKIDSLMLSIPNLPLDSVLLGKSSEDNKEILRKGTIPKFSFKPKPHYELGKELGILDLDASAKLAGTGFYVLKGFGARLERALINFFLDFHLKNGFIEVCPPILVNEKTMTGTGQLPKFEQDLFKTREGYYLIPTSEVPLTNLHAEEMLEENDLPKHYCAFTPNFRVEAGRHGTESRGIFRLHQFDKVEMVSICLPEQSTKELEFLRKQSEALLELLELPFRTLELCTADLAFSSAKTYDLEVWSPFLEKYLETSSISNCTDFQARRMNTKYKTKEGKAFVHTLNGSGLATPRLLISLIECNQQEDGSIKVPKCLHKYTGFKEIAKE